MLRLANEAVIVVVANGKARATSSDYSGRTSSRCREDVGNFLLGHFHECLDHDGIKLSAPACEQTTNRFFVGKTLAVTTIRNHRIVCVNDRHDSRANRYFFTLQPTGISAPVIALMVMERVETGFVQAWK